MKLYATITNEKGKVADKSGNEYLEIVLKDRNANRFRITFEGDCVDVLNYANGTTTHIDYAGAEIGYESKRKDIEDRGLHGY